MAKPEKLTSFGPIIKKYRKAAEYTQKDIADMFGVSRTTVNLWENNSARPDVETIRGLAEELGIPLSELFSMPVREPDRRERLILGYYRQLDNDDQEIVENTMRDMVRVRHNRGGKILQGAFHVVGQPATDVAAGTGCEFVDDKPTYHFIRNNELSNQADYIVRVSGRSMEPIYHDGSFVYIKESETADDGDDVICSTADGAVIKHKIGNRLYSLNRDLPYGEKSEDDNVQIRGIVLGVVSPQDFAAPEDTDALETYLHDEVFAFKEKFGLL